MSGELRVVGKFELSLADKQVVWIPRGSLVLSVDNQNDLWACIASGQSSVCPTEPCDRVFLGIALMDGRAWEVFERIE
jgi:hypothetical protein